jgi:hypothetical protein
MRKPKSQQQHVRAAYSRARKLGKLQVVKAETRDDGSPMLAEGQVYVTKSGAKFHTEWCHIINDNWNKNPKGILVTLQAGVGARLECQACIAESDYQAFLGRENG